MANKPIYMETTEIPMDRTAMTQKDGRTFFEYFESQQLRLAAGDQGK
jgi:hypothetical protein